LHRRLAGNLFQALSIFLAHFHFSASNPTIKNPFSSAPYGDLCGFVAKATSMSFLRIALSQVIEQGLR
jgi:hypothetical protein